MYSPHIALLDMRQIRDALHLLTYKLDISVSEDIFVILEMYGLAQLVTDLITYGALYTDIPGRPHYAIIYDSISKKYSTELDREMLDILLEEIEWIVYNVVCNHPGALQVLKISYPLISVRLIYVDY